MIGLYCPDLPPIPGGVADHTMVLARALERRGTPVAVFGRRGDAAPFAPLPVRLGITPDALANALREFAIRALYVQYVPFLFARFGVAPALAPALERLREDGARIAVFVHEPFVPFTRLPWLVTGVPQRFQLRRIVRAAHRVYAAAPAFVDICRGYAANRESVVLTPVGANFPPSTLDRDAARARLGLGAGTVAIGVFSPAASGYLLGWVREAMAQLAARTDVQWIVFGHGSAVLFPGTPANVRALGPLDRDGVAATARALDLFVAPYEDGLTMRRSSAMLGLAAGLPVVSSRGALFDSALASYAACEGDAGDFVARVTELVDRPDARAALAARAAASAPVSSVDTLAARLVSDLEAR